jgi:hypothetical protein
MRIFLAVISVLFFLTSAQAADFQFSDFNGVYYVKSCTLEVNMIQQPGDYFCDLSMIVVTKKSDLEFDISYILKTGLILHEENLKTFENNKDAIQDVAAFTGYPDRAQWFRRYKDTKENTFIDQMRQFSPSKDGEPYVHFVSAHGWVHDLDYKFTRYDYELERLRSEEILNNY